MSGQEDMKSAWIRIGQAVSYLAINPKDEEKSVSQEGDGLMEDDKDIAKLGVIRWSCRIRQRGTSGRKLLRKPGFYKFWDNWREIPKSCILKYFQKFDTSITFS